MDFRQQGTATARRVATATEKGERFFADLDTRETAPPSARLHLRCMCVHK